MAPFFWAFTLTHVCAASLGVDDGKNERYISLEKATQLALGWAERIPNHVVRGMRVTFIPNGSILMKGYRGTIPSEVKPNRAYWVVILDYYKVDSLTMEFGGRITIDAVTGERVDGP